MFGNQSSHAYDHVVNPIVLQRPISVGHVNELRVPEDMLYAQVDGMLHAPLKINGQLLVSSRRQCNVSDLNGFPLDELSHYLGNGGVAQGTLHVEQAQLDGPPVYETLNGNRMEQLLDRLWLDNERVELRGVHIASASFQGLLEYEVSRQREKEGKANQGRHILIDFPINRVH